MLGVMDRDVDKILNDAASNVACESNKEVSKETLESIKKQLIGESKRSDNSFIYGLYKSIIDNEERENNGKTHVKK